MKCAQGITSHQHCLNGQKIYTIESGVTWCNLMALTWCIAYHSKMYKTADALYSVCMWKRESKKDEGRCMSLDAIASSCGVCVRTYVLILTFTSYTFLWMKVLSVQSWDVITLTGAIERSIRIMAAGVRSTELSCLTFINV